MFHDRLGRLLRAPSPIGLAGPAHRCRKRENWESTTLSGCPFTVNKRLKSSCAVDFQISNFWHNIFYTIFCKIGFWLMAGSHLRFLWLSAADISRCKSNIGHSRFLGVFRIGFWLRVFCDFQRLISAAVSQILDIVVFWFFLLIRP